MRNRINDRRRTASVRRPLSTSMPTRLGASSIAGLTFVLGAAVMNPAEAKLCARAKAGAPVVVRTNCNEAERTLDPTAVVLCANKTGKISLHRDECTRSAAPAVDLVPSASCPRPYLIAAPPVGVTLTPRTPAGFEPKANVDRDEIPVPELFR